jgi:hypothetical protein
VPFGELLLLFDEFFFVYQEVFHFLFVTKHISILMRMLKEKQVDFIPFHNYSKILDREKQAKRIRYRYENKPGKERKKKTNQ